MASLRKLGNHLKNSTTTFKPARKSKHENSFNNFEACSHCYGLYSSKYLYRHLKNCPEKQESDKQPPFSKIHDLPNSDLLTSVNLLQEQAQERIVSVINDDDDEQTHRMPKLSVCEDSGEMQKLDGKSLGGIKIKCGVSENPGLAERSMFKVQVCISIFRTYANFNS